MRKNFPFILLIPFCVLGCTLLDPNTSSSSGSLRFSVDLSSAAASGQLPDSGQVTVAMDGTSHSSAFAIDPEAKLAHASISDLKPGTYSTVVTLNKDGETIGTTNGNVNVVAGKESGVIVALSFANVGSLTLNEDGLTLDLGSTYTLIPAFPSASAVGSALSWSSSDSAVATVDNEGLVSAISVGYALITVSTADLLRSDSCLVTVRAVIPSTGPVPVILQ